MKRIFFYIACIALFSFSSVSLFAQAINEQAYKFEKVLEGIQKYYVDSVDQNRLVEQAITGLLKDLDPHSSYLNKNEVSRLNEQLQGNFEGIGISFNVLNDTVYVINPVNEGPSFKAGIQSGDRIIKVDGNNIAGIGIQSEDVFAMLRGKKGSLVNLSVMRKGIDGLTDFEIVRDRIPIFSVDASYKVDNSIGYIKINRFSMTTLEEFSRAVKDLRAKNMKDLILDLTGNGGGYLDVAIKMADQFLDDDKLIVYTEGTNSPRKEYHATRDGIFEKGRLVILIDEGSASASEILSGAIQDWDRGIIVGRRSYGKGLVQRQLPLPDQSMIRLTVAKYYTPTGRLIQKPYKMSRDEYEKDLVKRFNHGEFAHKDSIHLPDSLKFYTLRNTRLVYGGGGIMPDYFVSIDTSYYSDYYQQLLRKRTIDLFALEYVDRHRDELLAKYNSVESFNNSFELSSGLMDRFISYSTTKGVPYNETHFNVSKSQLELLLKAYMARDLWTNSAFYEVTNQKDPKFETAVTILENWDNYEAMLLNKK